MSTTAGFLRLREDHEAYVVETGHRDCEVLLAVYGSLEEAKIAIEAAVAQRPTLLARGWSWHHWDCYWLYECEDRFIPPFRVISVNQSPVVLTPHLCASCGHSSQDDDEGLCVRCAQPLLP